MKMPRRKPLTRSEVVEMAERIRDLLGDPDAGLTESIRRRWEGALTALEAVLGEAPSLVGEEPERLRL